MTGPGQYLAEHGMYRPEFEGDACAVSASSPRPMGGRRAAWCSRRSMR
ncbi:hypothetical protein AB5I41_16360 [Sphingomonas sp. MMS24-JH45]